MGQEGFLYVLHPPTGERVCVVPHLGAERFPNVGAAHGYALTVLRDQPDLQHRVISASNSAFVSGFHLTALAGAGVIALTALAVLRWLPGRAVEELEIERVTLL